MKEGHDHSEQFGHFQIEKEAQNVSNSLYIFMETGSSSNKAEDLSEDKREELFESSRKENPVAFQSDAIHDSSSEETLLLEAPSPFQQSLR